MSGPLMDVHTSHLDLEIKEVKKGQVVSTQITLGSRAAIEDVHSRTQQKGYRCFNVWISVDYEARNPNFREGCQRHLQIRVQRWRIFRFLHFRISHLGIDSWRDS